MNDKIKFLIIAFEKVLQISDSPDQFRYIEILHIIKDMLQKKQYKAAFSTIKNELKFSFYKEEHIVEKEFTQLLHNEVKEEYRKYLFSEQCFSNKMTSIFLKENNIEVPYNDIFLITEEESVHLLIKTIKQSEIENKEAIIVMINVGLELHLQYEKLNNGE